MSGMLTAITDFIKDSFNEESGALKTLQYGKLTIYLERGVGMYLAVVFHGEPPHDLRERMRWLLIHLWETFKLKLKVWDGSMDGLDGIEGVLRSLMDQTGPQEDGTTMAAAPLPENQAAGPVVSIATEAVMCGICMGVVKPGLEITTCNCNNYYHKTCGERIGTCPKCSLSLVGSPPVLEKVEEKAEVPLPGSYLPPPPEEILNDDTKMLPEYSGQRAGEQADFKIEM